MAHTPTNTRQVAIETKWQDVVRTLRVRECVRGCEGVTERVREGGLQKCESVTEKVREGLNPFNMESFPC